MIATAATGLLDGPPPGQGFEPLRSHLARLGPLPRPGGLIDQLEAARLLGRGGAAFPAATKWRAVAAGAARGPVVVANGAEGEPLSRKDMTLITARPHLVLDGALLAAGAVGATRIAILIAEDRPAAWQAMAAALAERSRSEQDRTRLVAAPARYVAGESSAASTLAGGGPAVPTEVPPRPHERGVDGKPTLVQNVETLAHAALIARIGAAAFRAAGRGQATGTHLLTIHAGDGPRVVEVPAGTTVGEAIRGAGGSDQAVSAVLLGGYFGKWVEGGSALQLPLDPVWLRQRGLTMGSGVVAVLRQGSCGVCETARVMRYAASQSSAQCGPCFFGLAALAGACERIAADRPQPGDVDRLHRWARDVRGRGACHHPDGAAAFLESALEVFGLEFNHHPRHAGAGGTR